VREHLGPINTVDGYYGGDDGRLLILLLRPQGSSMSVDASRALLARVQAVVDALAPARYHPRLTVGFTGTLVTAIEEYDALRADMLSTALLCVALVVLAIVVYFFRLRPALLLGATLLIALGWTFALVHVTVGYLNSQTAFLGAIILGTGINYGIILLGRYFEERRARGPAAAMEEALLQTARPTFLAAASTALAFGVLVAAGVRSLAQFGFIGGAGILACWLATVLVLPVLTLVADRGGRPTRRAQPFGQAWCARAARLVEERPQAIVVGTLALVALSLAAVVRFAPDAIEYDFGKLRNRASHASGTDRLDRLVGRLFDVSTVPTVIHVDSPDEALAVERAILARVAAQPDADRVVESVTTIHDLLPRDLDQKRAILGEIDHLLDDKWLASLPAPEQDRVARVRRVLAHPDLGIADLPDELARTFTDLSGRRGTVLFVNPRRYRYFSDGRNLIAFAATLRALELPGGKIVDAAGDATVFADLIEIIRREAPLLTLASLLAVVGLVVLGLGRRGAAAFIVLVSLTVGIVLMLGLAALLQLRVNFFNFIILPLTIGIAVDYALNVALRLDGDAGHDLGHVLRHTGGAVMLCSLTTIIGYWVLTRAENQALASFGLAAIVGELTCIAAALVVTPALMVLHRRGILFRPDRWFVPPTEVNRCI
jgi:predicted exporter